MNPINVNARELGERAEGWIRPCVSRVALLFQNIFESARNGVTTLGQRGFQLLPARFQDSINQARGRVFPPPIPSLEEACQDEESLEKAQELLRIIPENQRYETETLLTRWMIFYAQNQHRRSRMLQYLLLHSFDERIVLIQTTSLFLDLLPEGDEALWSILCAISHQKPKERERVAHLSHRVCASGILSTDSYGYFIQIVADNEIKSREDVVLAYEKLAPLLLKKGEGDGENNVLLRSLFAFKSKRGRELIVEFCKRIHDSLSFGLVINLLHHFNTIEDENRIESSLRIAMADRNLQWVKLSGPGMFGMLETALWQAQSTVFDCDFIIERLGEPLIICKRYFQEKFQMPAVLLDLCTTNLEVLLHWISYTMKEEREKYLRNLSLFLEHYTAQYSTIACSFLPGVSDIEEDEWIQLCQQCSKLGQASLYSEINLSLHFLLLLRSPPEQREKIADRYCHLASLPLNANCDEFELWLSVPFGGVLCHISARESVLPYLELMITLTDHFPDRTLAVVMELLFQEMSIEDFGADFKMLIELIQSKIGRIESVVGIFCALYGRLPTFNYKYETHRYFSDLAKVMRAFPTELEGDFSLLRMITCVDKLTLSIATQLVDMGCLTTMKRFYFFTIGTLNHLAPEQKEELSAAGENLTLEMLHSAFYKYLEKCSDQYVAIDVADRLILLREQLGLQDQHPLLYLAVCISYREDSESNPYHIHKTHLARKPQAVSFPSYQLESGAPVAINQGRLRELNELFVINLSDLPPVSLFTWQAIRTRLVESDTVERTLAEISDDTIDDFHMILQSPFLESLLQIETEPLPIIAAQWKAIVHYLNQADEEQCVRLLCGIQNCSAGKSEGIAITYHYALPQEFKVLEKSMDQDPATCFLVSFLQTTLSRLLSGQNAFMHELTGIEGNIEQFAHSALFAKNLLSSSIGYKHTVAFDVHTDFVAQRLKNLPVEEALQIFGRHFTPQFLATELQKAFKAKQVEYSVLDNYIDHSIWDIEEEVGLTLEGAKKVLLTAGILIQPVDC